MSKETYYSVKRDLVVGLFILARVAPRANGGAHVVDLFELGLVPPEQVHVEPQLGENLAPHLADPDVVHREHTDQVHRQVQVPALFSDQDTHGQQPKKNKQR